MDKENLRRMIVGRLEQELSTLVGAANASRSEATDVDNRQEGKFDMRGQLAAYLAAGQAKLAEELAEAIVAFRQLSFEPAPARSSGNGGAPAALGSIVGLEGASGRAWYFLGPARGGMDIELSGATITVVTATSPIGRALFGRRVGESVALPGRRGQFGTLAELF
jgi:transcription elongation GreA/GreB family factor